MTELSYMVREDWAQCGTAMARQSQVIRDWLGEPPYLFMAPELEKYKTEHDAEREFVNFVAPDPSSRAVFPLTELAEAKRQGGAVLEHPIVVLHPYKERDCELLREVTQSVGALRIFVIVWARSDLVRTMLGGLGAVDLHTGQNTPPPDGVLLEAAACMVHEQYNGLGSGRGKDAVVQLLRSFTAAGYPLDSEMWLSAFFAAGGEFDEAAKVSKLITEMKRGVKHRVKQRYKREIVEILRSQAGEKATP